jgi:xylulokinase
MDNSTSHYVKLLSKKSQLSGDKIATLTGSYPTNRFTGLHISKLIGRDKDTYERTKKIQLISTLMSTVFTSDLEAPLDLSDGCGMNMINLHTKAYDIRLLKAIAGVKPDSDSDVHNRLLDKLPRPIASTAVIGKPGCALRSALPGLPEDCSIISCSGDNLCTVAGLALQPGDLAISLGTSDVLIGISTTMPRSESSCNTFINCCDSNSFITIICATNGALSRNKLCDKHADSDWHKFDKMITSEPAGNTSKIGIWCDVAETVPEIHKPGIYRYDCGKSMAVETEFTPAQECRAIVESRALSFKLRAQSCGLTNADGQITRIICTGGGANSAVFLQILADVFQCPVFVPEGVSNGAAVGAAVRAAHGAFNENSPRTRQATFDTLCGPMLRSSMKVVAQPDPMAVEVYNELIAGYDDFECDVQFKAGEWKAEREEKELERRALEKMEKKHGKGQKGKNKLSDSGGSLSGGGNGKSSSDGKRSELPDYTMLYIGVVLGVVLSAAAVKNGWLLKK